MCVCVGGGGGGGVKAVLNINVLFNRGWLKQVYALMCCLTEGGGLKQVHTTRFCLTEGVKTVLYIKMLFNSSFNINSMSRTLNQRSCTNTHTYTAEC